MKATQNNSENENTPKTPSEVLANLKNRYKDNPQIFREILLQIDISSDKAFFESLETYLSDKEDAYIINKIFNSKIEDVSVEMNLHKLAEQGIVKEVDRPVFLINNDQLNFATGTIWEERIKENLNTIEKVIPSIGRIEIKGDDVDFIGTGWLIKNTNIIVTNRHVADQFAARKEDKFVFKQDWMGDTYAVHIDFKEEHTTSLEQHEFEIKQVVYWAKERDLDIALLRVDEKNDKKELLPQGLELSYDIPNLKEEIYVIGYPACNKPEHRNLKNKFFNGIAGKKQLAPGNFSKTGTSKYIYRHDCTTWGGNSGSPVIDLITGKVLGIHYAGVHEDFEGYRANYAVSVLALIEILEELKIFYNH